MSPKVKVEKEEKPVEEGNKHIWRGSGSTKPSMMTKFEESYRKAQVKKSKTEDNQ